MATEAASVVAPVVVVMVSRLNRHLLRRPATAVASKMTGRAA